jgi:hypothetical protein
MPVSGGKAPNSNLQAPEKLQASISRKTQFGPLKLGT